MQLSKSFSENCTIFDVVMQCYFSLDLLPKLIEDNKITDVNFVTFAGQSFVYDTDLVADEFLNKDTAQNGYVFCTGELKPTDPPTSRVTYLRAENGSILRTENKKDIRI